MSLQFNDTATHKGLVQLYERECGFNPGDVSGNTTRLKQFAADANLAWDTFLTLAFKSNGTWQFDDSNHEDNYPFIKTNLVSGRRDYTFLADESGNLVLDIYKVMIANQSGTYYEVFPADQQSRSSNNQDTSSFFDGLNTTGLPIRYDKTGNSIFLDPIPNYDYTNGLKVFINREASYFAYDDVVKKPGVPGVLHSYFALKPALDYIERNGLKNYTQVALKVKKLEDMIEEVFGSRQKDIEGKFIASYRNSR